MPISADAVANATTAPAPTPSSGFLGNALLVEDEELVRISTADMLAELGFDVTEAATAAEALRLVEQGYRPDLLVTDHLMPGMTGAELVRDLRARFPELRTLIISGYAEAEGIDPTIPRLTKPFRNDELAACLLSLAQKRVAH